MCGMRSLWQQMSEKKTARKEILYSVFCVQRLRGIIVGLAFLTLLAVFAGYISYSSVDGAEELQVYDPPTFEIYSHETPFFEFWPEEEIPPLRQIPKPEPVLPKVAIIIDDIGYDSAIAEKFLSLDAAITFSILPHSPFLKKISSRAKTEGIETMLHLPMEPREYPQVNPGPGALLTSMPPEQIISQLRKNLDSLPFIKGVNNHMGSRMTTFSTNMYQILSVLKKRDLFFIDSVTTGDSLCRSSARLLQVPFAQRDVFLDHVQDADFVRRQFRQLIRVANHYGEAVGIGHPHNVTYQIFREALPELRKKVRLVPASEIVHNIG
ncbi:MAG TPA: divergent polysaccharide deacetylase family protein [Desulfobacterales bacterium]|nr:divergent polysaccharide deacetylase family protein [Desulfobacterales bacterium]